MLASPGIQGCRKHLQPLGLDLGEALGEGEEVVQPRLPLPLVVRLEHRHQQLVRLLLQ